MEVEHKSFSLWSHKTAIVNGLDHDDVIKWKHFPRYWSFMRGIHRSPVNSSHNGQWRGALMLSLICARIKGWVNNGEAGDLRRHHASDDVIVMGNWPYYNFEALYNARYVHHTWHTCLSTYCNNMMTSSNGNIFRVTGPLWGGIHQWREALMSSLMCAWTSGWANRGDAGDFRRHDAYCDVAVEQTEEMLVISDDMMLIVTSL